MTSILDNFYSGHIIVNDKRSVDFTNQYLVDHLGWDNTQLSKMNLSDLFTKASNIFIDSYVYPLLMHEHSAGEVQLTMLAANGDKLPVVANIRLDDQQVSYWSFYDCANRDKLYQELIIARELLQKQTDELIEMASLDSLTGLLNKRELNSRADNMLFHANKEKLSVAVFVLDIDFFKKINDTHGHFAGDKVLQRLSKILLKNRHNSDIVARFGGEEFVLLLSGIDETKALEIAEALRIEIEEQDFYGISITVSIGVSFNEKRITEFDTLFQQADSALFRAKKEGRNKTILA